jgi:hypothetical protein
MLEFVFSVSIKIYSGQGGEVPILASQGELSLNSDSPRISRPLLHQICTQDLDGISRRKFTFISPE